jgi:hypothetical protein
MNVPMPTRVATAVGIVPVTVRQRLDQMARNVAIACASFATAQAPPSSMASGSKQEGFAKETDDSGVATARS